MTASTDKTAAVGPLGGCGMSGGAHTAGRWSVFERPRDKTIGGFMEGTFVHCGPDERDDTGFDLIARVYTRDGFAEREANARLISAAPDLLAAAVLAEDIIDDFLGHLSPGEQEACADDPEAAAALKALRAAIQKARPTPLSEDAG